MDHLINMHGVESKEKKVELLSAPQLNFHEHDNRETILGMKEKAKEKIPTNVNTP